MKTLFLFAAILVAAPVAIVWGQPAVAPVEGPATAWRPAERNYPSEIGTVVPAVATTPAPAAGIPSTATAVGNLAPASAAAMPARPLSVRVTAGNGTLPNEQGQVWREYDISPYTSRVTTTRRPEQAIVDWILRETGYEAWHSEPLGVLSVTPRALRVYHTPQMQAVVTDLVERFVASEAETRTFSLRMVTIDNPNWRGRALRVLRSVPVQTPGTTAWLLAKEDAAVLLAELQRRNDYREHSSPHLLVNNGQATVVSAMRARTYTRDASPRPDVWPGYQGQPGQVEEGFSLEFSPLLSCDRRTIDAIVKCEIDQIEKLVPVVLEVPTQVSPRQRAKIEVPQISHFRFQERFRWPVDQVLLIGMGMVALPVPIDTQPSVAGLPLPLPSSPPRADLLVIVESKGPVAETPGAARAPSQEAASRVQGLPR